MYSSILDRWIRIKASFWFVPALTSVAAVFLAIVMVRIDGAVSLDWARKELGWLYDNQPDGARAILATVAGSMITVAGVTFSMTLLMLSHASAQIGPRLLSGFMRDRGNQIVLGTYIATFLYCLLILRSVRSESEIADGDLASAFVPHLSVNVGIALAILSVAVLIYFIHHVPMRLNISDLTNRIGMQILTQIDKLYPSGNRSDERREKIGSQLESERVDVTANPDLIRLECDGGYLRVLDYDQMISIACKADCLLEVLVLPGMFCVRGTPLMRVLDGSLDDEQASEVQGLFSWGGERTRDQDILFLIGQLVEISGRALSPGVNDQFTAIACIDQLERILSEACGRKNPYRYRFDGDGRLRCIVARVTVSELIDHCLIPLHQFAHGDYLTTNHLLKMIRTVLDRMARGAQERDTLLRHFSAIRDDAHRDLPAATHRDWISSDHGSYQPAD